MSTEENKRFILQANEEIWGEEFPTEPADRRAEIERHVRRMMDKYYSNNYSKKNEVMQSMIRLLEAFHRAKVTIDEGKLIAEGDKVTAPWTFEGFHVAPLKGTYHGIRLDVAPTRTQDPVKVKMSGTYTATIEGSGDDKKIIDELVAGDMIPMMQQMGIPISPER